MQPAPETHRGATCCWRERGLLSENSTRKLCVPRTPRALGPSVTPSRTAQGQEAWPPPFLISAVRPAPRPPQVLGCELRGRGPEHCHPQPRPAVRPASSGHRLLAAGRVSPGCPASSVSASAALCLPPGSASQRSGDAGEGCGQGRGARSRQGAGAGARVQQGGPRRCCPGLLAWPSSFLQARGASAELLFLHVTPILLQTSRR